MGFSAEHVTNDHKIMHIMPQFTDVNGGKTILNYSLQCSVTDLCNPSPPTEAFTCYTYHFLSEVKRSWCIHTSQLHRWNRLQKNNIFIKQINKATTTILLILVNMSQNNTGIQNILPPANQLQRFVYFKLSVNYQSWQPK
jgi:hypothetical protein